MPQDSHTPRSQPVWATVPESDRGSVRLLGTIVGIGVLQLLFYFGAVLHPWTKATISRPVYAATGGFVHPELAMNLAWLGLVLLVLRSESLTARDVGLRREVVGPALWSVLLVWVGAQMLLVTVTVVTTGRIPQLAVTPLFSDGVVVFAGLLVRELFGNSLYEEVLYRGFLTEQVRLHLGSLSGVGPSSALALALTGSQALFAFVHVPVRLYQGATVPQTALSVAALFVVGLLFAVVYYRTGNLLLAVGVHTLSNFPVFVFGATAQWAVWLATLGLLFVWPRLSLSQTAARPATVQPRD